jgi:hypothetical protein
MKNRLDYVEEMQEEAAWELQQENAHLRQPIRLCDLEDVVIDGIDTRDYPDFVDAYIVSAYHTGLQRRLTDEECERLTEEESGFVQQQAMEYAFG